MDNQTEIIQQNPPEPVNKNLVKSSPSKPKLPLVLLVLILLLLLGLVGIILGKYVSISQNNLPMPALAPKPTVIPTVTTNVPANWQTYTNLSYEFNLNYPPTLKESSTSSNAVDLVDQTINQKAISPSNIKVHISISPNNHNWSWEKIYNGANNEVIQKEQPASGSVFTRTRTRKIGGFNAVDYTENTLGNKTEKGIAKGTIIYYTGLLVEISTGDRNFTDFDQIVSTFKSFRKPEPTQIVESGYKETLTIFGLTLKPPASWWSEKRLDPLGGSIILSPESLQGDLERIEPFILSAVKDPPVTFNDQKKIELTRYGTESGKVREKTITLSGETAIILEGLTERGMMQPFNLKIAIISHNGVTYCLEDYTALLGQKYEGLFDQILSTFKFTQ